MILSHSQERERERERERVVQDGIYALGKAHVRSTPSLRSFHSVAFETVPVFV